MGRDIIFTTETDGLVRHQVVSDKYIHLFPNMLKITLAQPGDEHYTSLIIDNGVEIKERITKINGIDKSLIDQHGVSPIGALEIIDSLIQDGDCLVSHNVSFHLRVLKAFYHRLGRKFPDVSTKCLQTDGTGICRVPFNKDEPSDQYKKPSIDEMKEFFDIVVPGKMESLLAIYSFMKDVLNEERPVKPASF